MTPHVVTPHVDAAGRDVLAALLDGWCLPAMVPAALDIVERDPLAMVDAFRGDLLRGLMTVPGGFWGGHPALYDRFRASVRAGAVRRRRLPPDERMEFWSTLDGTHRPAAHDHGTAPTLSEGLA